MASSSSEQAGKRLREQRMPARACPRACSARAATCKPRAPDGGNKHDALPTTARLFWHCETTLQSRNRSPGADAFITKSCGFLCGSGWVRDLEMIISVRGQAPARARARGQPLRRTFTRQQNTFRAPPRRCWAPPSTSRVVCCGPAIIVLGGFQPPFLLP